MLRSMEKKELVGQIRSLIKDLKKENPNLSLLAERFDRLNESKVSAAWGREDVDQEIYINYMMAVHLYNFEVNDFIKIVYWLVRSNYMMATPLTQKLDSVVAQKINQISPKSLLRLLNTYSSSSDFKSLRSFDMIIERLKNLPITDYSDSANAALDLCKLELYDESLWKNLCLVNSTGDTDQLMSMSAVRLALQTEGTELQHTQIPELVNNCIAESLKVKTAEGDLSTSVKNNIPFLSVSKIHREVHFVLKSLLNFEENFKYKEVFDIDFYNPKENIGFDLHGPLHYFFPELGEKHDVMTEDRLIGFLKFKRRLLRKNNARVETIPYYEWNRYNDHSEKLLYLKKKLRLFRV